MKKPKLGVLNAAHPVVVPWDDGAELPGVSLAGSDKSGSVVHDAFRKASGLPSPLRPSRIAKVRFMEKS